MAQSYSIINNLQSLTNSGAMLQSAGVDLSNVRVNGIPVCKLPALEQWAVELGYRESAWLAAEARKHNPKASTK